MRIAISGYYGFGNAGDEAVLSATVSELHRRLPDADLVVLSGDVEATESVHEVCAAPRWPLGPLRRTIASADLLLSGGGSLLQDATSLRSLGYYLLTMELARRARVPYVIHAQGLGPLGGRLSRRAAAFALGRAAMVTVRDHLSLALARELGVAEERLALTADPAFLLEPVDVPEVDALLQGARVDPGQPLVGMVVREWEGASEALSAFVTVGRRAREQWQARTVILPFQLPDDLEVGHELAALLPDAALIEAEMHPGRLLALIGRLDLLIAMRLHALIFAAAQAVAAVGVSYDPKVEALCEEAGQRWVPLASHAGLADAAERAWTEREGAAGDRRSRAGELHRRAAVAFDAIERVCRSPG